MKNSANIILFSGIIRFSWFYEKIIVYLYPNNCNTDDEYGTDQCQKTRDWSRHW